MPLPFLCSNNLICVLMAKLLKNGIISIQEFLRRKEKHCWNAPGRDVLMSKTIFCGMLAVTVITR